MTGVGSLVLGSRCVLVDVQHVSVATYASGGEAAPSMVRRIRS